MTGPEASIPEWLTAENAKRASDYRRDDDAEAFLYRFNDILAPHEAEIAAPPGAPHPLVFIIGVPRAGKTLFSQVLSFCLDVGYIDNLTARFWRAPVYGIRLSRILQPRERTGAFASDYGKTGGPFGPHDFSYFWHHWLAMDAMPYDPASASAAIDWAALRDELARISAAHGRAGVFKSPNPAYHIGRLARLYPKSLFLYLQRDPIDSAVSLLKGRRDNFGHDDEWYGQWPDRHEHLHGLPAHAQIGGQLAALDDMFERGFAEAAPEQVLRLTYADFCADPAARLRQITDRLREAFDADVAVTREPPASFTLSRHDESGADYARLADGLRAAGLPLRLGD